MNPEMICYHVCVVCVNAHIMIVHVKHNLVSQKESNTKYHSCCMITCFRNHSKLTIIHSINVDHVNVKRVNDLKFPSIKSNQECWKYVCRIASTSWKCNSTHWVKPTRNKRKINLIKHCVPPQIKICHCQLNIVNRRVKSRIWSPTQHHSISNFQRVHRHLPLMRSRRLHIRPAPVARASPINKPPNH